MSFLKENELHRRTIIHLDMDYFYAQVEEVRNPSLRTQPLGVQQKNIVVTCNYVAREFGVTKLMTVADAMKRCPSLVLVNGEDLTPYRQISQKVFEILLSYAPLVEKLGFDENFVDVSSLIEADENLRTDVKAVGHIYPNSWSTGLADSCSCGCGKRLAIGSEIAKKMRDDIYSRLGLTCTAGISYNKLLAKLVGTQNKPNQQTVLVSSRSEQFMISLNKLSLVTGIGQKTESLLLENGVRNIEELQNCDMNMLKKKFGFETATKLKDLAFGKDASAVRPSGKPKSISLEDSCRPISVRTEVEERFRVLLLRLEEQVAEDGRIPMVIKIIIRKFDQKKKTSHRESKQANILPSLFKALPCSSGGAANSSGSGVQITFAEGAQEKLLKIIMRLFERLVDLSKPFNITLLGLAFSKFQQRKMGASSIANFLLKNTDLEVQSITSLTNDSTAMDIGSTTTTSNDPISESFRSSTTFQPSDQFYRRRAATASPIPMIVDNASESGVSGNSDFSDYSETEVEPSPKKSRIGSVIQNLNRRHRCLGSHRNSNEALASPSKLRVGDLRLNPHEGEITSNTQEQDATYTRRSSLDTDTCEVVVPPECSPDMTGACHALNDSPSAHCMENTTTCQSDIHCPKNVDPSVFKELPTELQNELIASWSKSLSSIASIKTQDGSAGSSASSTAMKSSDRATTAGSGALNKKQNTLYRYFLRNNQ